MIKPAMRQTKAVVLVSGVFINFLFIVRLLIYPFRYLDPDKAIIQDTGDALKIHTQLKCQTIDQAMGPHEKDFSRVK